MSNRVTVALASLTLLAVLAGCPAPSQVKRPRATRGPLPIPVGLVRLQTWLSTAPRPRAGCQPVGGDPAKWRHPVSTVALWGVPASLRAVVRQRIRLQPGQPYSQYRVRTDVRRIWDLGMIAGVRVQACKVGSGVEVTYVVRASRRIGKIQVYVDHPDEGRWHRRTVRRLWRQRPGNRLRRNRLRQDMESLRAVYRERGYWNARVEPHQRLGPADSADLVLLVRTGHRLFLGPIRIHGNRAVKTAALRKVMKTRSGGVYLDHVLERDLVLLRAYYYDRGYVYLELGVPKVAPGPNQRSLHVDLHIREGRQFRLGTVTLRGELLAVSQPGPAVIHKDAKVPAYAAARAALLRQVRSREGKVFSRSRIRDDIKRLTKLYKNYGYAYVSVTPTTDIDMKAARIKLTLEVNSGPVVTVERIQIRGRKRLPEPLVRGLVGLKPGERFQHDRLVNARLRLLATGLFRRVVISSVRGTNPDKIGLIVHVTEK